MAVTVLFGFMIGFMVLLAIQPAMAARRLDPPVEFLLEKPDRNKVVVAVAKAKNPEQRTVFSVTQPLSGESPAELVLRTDEASWNDIVEGKSYVLVWSPQRRNRSVIGGWEEDPDGPSIVEVMGLGSLALLEDTEHTRLLFAAGTATEKPGPFLDALLAQLQREDSRSRGLVLTELYLRPDLTAAMTTAQLDSFKSVVQAGVPDAQQSDFLLRAALNVPKQQTAPWLAEACRKTIIQQGSQYDLSTFVPGLVRTAAQCLQQVGAPADVELLSLLLYANNPGVSKAALAAMLALDPAASRVQMNLALQRGWILDETRDVMQQSLLADGS